MLDRFIKPSLVLGATLVLAAPVHAQYDPGATLMLGQGMGFSALSNNTYQNAIEATRQGNDRERPSASQRRDSSSSSSRRDASNGRSADGPVLRTQADVDRYMNERMAYHAKALAPEYKQRAARDGTASADRWIRARAEELGKMEGEKARQLVQRD
ncbi:hypothetical protein IMZ29_09855 [Achromobacter sp. GG226]|uniref:hypothetical protein n=1 Tax=Verticiella alkaliphila TaxID=2779529 RepID=UPI001C0B0693|nr:hypothetical protein [Verticiella sp. GG226]MBU4610823.1 hypothetical protein [Verticiella sp. GG226]